MTDTKKNKSKTSSKVKNAYNKKTYRHLLVPIKIDSDLDKILIDFAEKNPQQTSALIKNLLENHFKISQ